MRPFVSHIPCATSSNEQTSDIIKLTQFEEGNLLSETREDAESNDESGDKSDDDPIMPPLPNLEETDALDSGNESSDEPLSTETLEDIRDVSQSHLNVNSR